MFRSSLLLTVTMVVFLTSCQTRSSGPPPIAEAFAGPSTMNVRQELTLQSPVVATVRHGDRLEILQTRRRFAQVRTSGGAVGWIDSRQLLTPEQMQEIRRFADATSNLPSQGAASVVEPLNVHTEPNRTSPSFLQLPENASVQVIGHKLSPRTAPPEPRPLTVPRKSVKSARRGREKESRRIPPPPMPAPPKPPANWQELSHRRGHNEAGALAELTSAPPVNRKPPVMEDWSLIRTKDKKVGWVLSRMLSMSIPDEVAQYAEGHRITSYFDLADVSDGGQVKHAWLWTTISHGGNPYEFDGLRVFVWSIKHHRYETVYRERDVKGFYPVEAIKSTGGDKGVNATFSIPCEVDGQLIRKTYLFNGYRVNLVRREPYTLPRQEIQIAGGTQTTPASNGAGNQAQPWYMRFRNQMKSWFR